MEDDEETTRSIPPWVELEYTVCSRIIDALPSLLTFSQHMRMLAGKDAHIHFTHLSKTSSESLSAAFRSATSDLSKSSCYEYGVLDLMKSKGISLDKVCLLDPKAETALSPDDGDGRFEVFLFGVSIYLTTAPNTTC